MSNNNNYDSSGSCTPNFPLFNGRKQHSTFANIHPPNLNIASSASSHYSNLQNQNSSNSGLGSIFLPPPPLPPPPCPPTFSSKNSSFNPHPGSNNLVSQTSHTVSIMYDHPPPFNFPPQINKSIPNLQTFPPVSPCTPNIQSSNLPFQSYASTTQGTTGSNARINMIDFSRPPPTIGSNLYTPSIMLDASLVFHCKSDEGLLIKSDTENMGIHHLAVEGDQWLKGWIKELESVDVKRTPEGQSNLKISDFEQALLRWSSLLSRFAEIHHRLKYDTLMSPEMEITMYKRIEQAKKEISDASDVVMNDSNLSQLKQLIAKRRLKRLRQRVSRNRKKAQQREMKKKWMEKEREIDEWRNRLIKEEREKLESEALRSDADSILLEVRSKISDAAQLSQVLQNLSNLRAARVKKGANHGYNSSPSQDRYFESICDKLQSTINDQLEQYKLEEQTLKIMMDHTQIGSKKYSSRTSRKSISLESAEDIVEDRKKEIQSILFGTQIDICEDGIESKEQLVERRCEWDEFVVASNAGGSSIPLSWVVPPSCPSENWEEFKQS